MSWLAVTSLASLIFASIPALVFARNLRFYRPTPAVASSEALPPVSVLIPARNEEDSIRECVLSVLENRGVEFEVVVLDDDSTDTTAAIVAQLTAADRRVRVAEASLLPEGWCGKQHACHELSRLAKHDLMLFLDADVRLQPDALSRSVSLLVNGQAGLLSGFPRQITVTLFEQLLLPLMHFALLGFLPVWRMRASRHPAYAAGCGQFMLVRRDAYVKAGGHAGIRTSLHDGIQLPTAFRRADQATDLFDATDLASCRMYHSASEVFAGLAKNAVEGVANPRLILPVSLLLGVGQVLPVPLLIWSLIGRAWMAAALALLAGVLMYLPRILGVVRFRQSALGAALHPLGIVAFLAIQWYALVRHLSGSTARWKGREYAAGGIAHVDEQQTATLSGAG